MTIQHHPTDDSLLAYANGSLSPALSGAVRVHLERCTRCCESVRLAEGLGGALLEAQVPAEMDARLFFQLLEKLDQPHAEPAQVRRKNDIGIPLPQSLAHQRIGSRRWLAPGIWIRPVLKDRQDGTRLYLLGAAAGKSLPVHGHAGVEMTQVLSGAFFDNGMRYGPGDFLEADSELEHSLTIADGAECVCVVASRGLPSGLPGLLMWLLS